MWSMEARIIDERQRPSCVEPIRITEDDRIEMLSHIP